MKSRVAQVGKAIAEENELLITQKNFLKAIVWNKYMDVKHELYVKKTNIKQKYFKCDVRQGHQQRATKWCMQIEEYVEHNKKKKGHDNRTYSETLNNKYCFSINSLYITALFNEQNW